MKPKRMVWFYCGVSIAAVICLAEDTVRTQKTRKAGVRAALADSAPAAKKPDRTTNLPVIGHLETRDKIITIQSGPNGLCYLVKTKDGKVLHENLSEEQLKAKAPDIHELIKTSVAGKSANDGAFMDARVRAHLGR